MRRFLVLLLVLCAAPALAGWEEGIAAFTSKNFTVAAQEFAEVVGSSPENWQARYMLGLALEQLKRRDEALAHLRKAYDLNPNDLSVGLALARVYRGLGKNAGP